MPTVIVCAPVTDFDSQLFGRFRRGVAHPSTQSSTVSTIMHQSETKKKTCRIRKQTADTLTFHSPVEFRSPIISLLGFYVMFLMQLTDVSWISFLCCLPTMSYIHIPLSAFWLSPSFIICKTCEVVNVHSEIGFREQQLYTLFHPLAFPADYDFYATCQWLLCFCAPLRRRTLCIPSAVDRHILD